MSRDLLERRLVEVAERLKHLRAVADEQLGALSDMAEEARLRALVSETPLADQELREATKHLDAMHRHRSDVEHEIGDLERDQDSLLDRLVAGS